MVESSLLGLCALAWAAGEYLSVRVLGASVVALATGAPVPDGGEPPDPLTGLGSIGLLLLWLAGWSGLGFELVRQLLRRWWAEDRIELEPAWLRVTSRLGPFVSTRLVARGEIRRILLLPPSGALTAQLSRSGQVALTALGPREDRLAAVEVLRIALGLTDEDADRAGLLPEDWQEVVLPEGPAALVAGQAAQRRQAQLAAAFASLAGAGAVLFPLSRPSGSGAFPWIPALGLVAACAGAAALWLFRARIEWRIEPGRLVRQRRFGARVTELEEVRALELTEAPDDEGDLQCDLEAVVVERQGSRVGKRILLVRAFNDPTGPRALGRYLAREAGIGLAASAGKGAGPA